MHRAATDPSAMVALRPHPAAVAVLLLPPFEVSHGRQVHAPWRFVLSPARTGTPRNLCGEMPQNFRHLAVAPRFGKGRLG